MPSCVISNCLSKTGRKDQSIAIRLHSFPKDPQRIQQWLNQTGQNFTDINKMIQTIIEDKFQKFRMCSLHFSQDCYKETKHCQTLRQDALPTIFQQIPEGKCYIEETLKKDRKKKKMKRPFDHAVAGTSTSEDLALDDFCKESLSECHPKQCSVSTQTDYTLLNAMIFYISGTDTSREISSNSDVLSLSPITLKSNPNFQKTSSPKTVSSSEFSSPQKKKALIQIETKETCDFQEDDINFQDIIPLSPIEEAFGILEESIDTESDAILDKNDGYKDEDYLPQDTSMTDSDLLDSASLIYPHHPPSPPKMTPLTLRQQVIDRKLLVFESCLDNLIMKVKCQYTPECNYLVKSFTKKFDASACKIYGKCYQGHQFTIFESQPKIGRMSSGNLLLSASILFSGLNFQKVNELFNILGMVSISEKTYYRHQSKFLFPSIDIAWQEEKNKNFEELKTTPLCVSGDGQCDSPGHNAKYCTYTILDSLSDKILDFEVVQKSQCTSSVAMEKFGFKICLERIINSGLKVLIFASDRHVSIRKTMRLDYPHIRHQFDVWHYAKSIKKKLTQASHQRFCKEITPWIDKIGLHFWWSIQTCDDNEENLKERWLSLLHHIADEHEWDGKLYTQCSHGSLDAVEQEGKVLWLNKETAPYLTIEKIVNNPQLIAELPHLVNNCHTGSLENFHSLVLKYRTKRIHFGIDAMEARTKLAALTHNKNVGREQATVKKQNKNTEEKGTKRTRLIVPKGKSRWIVKNVYEKISVEYLEDLAVNVLKIANGEVTSAWSSRAPSLPPNLANLERPNKEEIKQQKIARFRTSCQIDAR
ncbi:uncharacterized protein LOC142750022 [Rhinoderma darwinii]|uniref:uncharacterized protein LOC142749981 n=1 Tax=Rhinoderma darwinii TaxID=43563 RepID=UPI003F66C8D8